MLWNNCCANNGKLHSNHSFIVGQKLCRNTSHHDPVKPRTASRVFWRRCVGIPHENSVHATIVLDRWWRNGGLCLGLRKGMYGARISQAKPSCTFSKKQWRSLILLVGFTCEDVSNCPFALVVPYTTCTSNQEHVLRFVYQLAKIAGAQIYLEIVCTVHNAKQGADKQQAPN